MIALTFRGTVVRRATVIALLVGTLLALINHGDAIVAGELSRAQIFKIALTYLVPYGVSTWSSVAALRNAYRAGAGKRND